MMTFKQFYLLASKGPIKPAKDPMRCKSSKPATKILAKLRAIQGAKRSKSH